MFVLCHSNKQIQYTLINKYNTYKRARAPESASLDVYIIMIMTIGTILFHFSE